MANLADPVFIDIDPAVVLDESQTLFEAVTGRSLFPDQPEQLILNLLSYRETLTRIGVQYAAEQGLVNYAIGVNLDQLGELVATPRLAAKSAVSMVTFTKVAGATAIAVSVPTGSLVQTASNVIFQTDEGLTIGVGETTGSVGVTCLEAGTIGNGFTAGQISGLANPITNILSVSNTTTSSDGAEIETDVAYRERIKLAPNAFTTAGSAGQYTFLTRKVSQLIVDVYVFSPTRSQVKIYPLLSTGLPSPSLLTAIDTALDDQTVRPICDQLEVLSPTEVTYTLAATVVVLSGTDEAIAQTEITAALTAYTAERRSRLGLDIIQSHVIAAAFLSYVKNVSAVVITPNTGGNLAIAQTEWANCAGITVTISGSEVP